MGEVLIGVEVDEVLICATVVFLGALAVGKGLAGTFAEVRFLCGVLSVTELSQMPNSL